MDRGRAHKRDSARSDQPATVLNVLGSSHTRLIHTTKLNKIPINIAEVKQKQTKKSDGKPPAIIEVCVADFFICAFLVGCVCFVVTVAIGRCSFGWNCWFEWHMELINAPFLKRLDEWVKRKKKTHLFLFYFEFINNLLVIYTLCLCFIIIFIDVSLYRLVFEFFKFCFSFGLDLKIPHEIWERKKQTIFVCIIINVNIGPVYENTFTQRN